MLINNSCSGLENFLFIRDLMTTFLGNVPKKAAAVKIVPFAIRRAVRGDLRIFVSKNSFRPPQAPPRCPPAMVMVTGGYLEVTLPFVRFKVTYDR